MDWWFFGGKRGLTVMLDLMQRHARADATVMPDLIGHLSMTTEKQKRHLTWAEMPLKCNKIVTSYDNGKVTNLNDSHKNKHRKRKRWGGQVPQVL